MRTQHVGRAHGHGTGHRPTHASEDSTLGYDGGGRRRRGIQRLLADGNGRVVVEGLSELVDRGRLELCSVLLEDGVALFAHAQVALRNSIYIIYIIIMKIQPLLLITTNPKPKR